MGIQRWPFQVLKPVEQRIRVLEEKQRAANRLGLQLGPKVLDELAMLQKQRDELMLVGRAIGGDRA